MTQQCAHTNAVPVDSDGRTVAGLCPDCDTQLPAAWFTCDHTDTVEITDLSQRYPEHYCPDCGATFAGTVPVEP